MSARSAAQTIATGQCALPRDQRETQRKYLSMTKPGDAKPAAFSMGRGPCRGGGNGAAVELCVFSADNGASNGPRGSPVPEAAKRGALREAAFSFCSWEVMSWEVMLGSDRGRRLKLCEEDIAGFCSV